MTIECFVNGCFPRRPLNTKTHVHVRMLFLQGQYYVYLNAQYAHLGWHVGLTKSGKAKKGHRTTYPFGQKAIQFTRKPIVTPTPHFDLDLTKHQEDLTFIDEGQQVDVHKGPKQIGNIKYIDK